jgi:putative transposase
MSREELYGIAVSPDLISRVTDAVIEEVREWRNRPSVCVYPIVVFDALRVKIRDDGIVRNTAVYLAPGISTGGEKDALGIWIEQTEGAKFWLKVMNEAKNHGVQDVLIAVVDGLKGFPDTIHTVPLAQVQTGIVHMVRNSLDYCSYKDRKAVAADLKTIYRAETETIAQARLAEFAEKWGTKYPPIVQSWRRNWEHVVPFAPASRPDAPTGPRRCCAASSKGWAHAAVHVAPGRLAWPGTHRPPHTTGPIPLPLAPSPIRHGRHEHRRRFCA